MSSNETPGGGYIPDNPTDDKPGPNVATGSDQTHIAQKPDKQGSTVDSTLKTEAPVLPNTFGSPESSLPAAPRNLLRSLSPSRSQPEPRTVSNDDEASIEGISKSLAGFLTTASVYTGFHDVEDDFNADDELQSPDSPDTPDESPLDHKPTPVWDPEKFGLDKDTQLISSYPCWSIGDVLLQGRFFITSNMVLFSATLPHENNKVVKAEVLTMRSTTRKISPRRKWAVLRENTLSIFSSSTELYFPELVIDLSRALRAEVYHGHKAAETKPTWFKLVTAKGKHWFLADSAESARQWVSALRRQIFQAHNKGQDVVMKTPVSSILSVDLTPVMGDCTNLKIVSTESYAVDDHYLLFFSEGDHARIDIESVIEQAKASPLAESGSGSSTISELPQKNASHSSLNLQRASEAFGTLTSAFYSQKVHHFISAPGDPFWVEDEDTRNRKEASFRMRFSFNDSEKLLATYCAYIVRGIPSYGKIYLGSRHICFRSILPGTSTMMILPLQDVETASKEKGFRLGYSGLVIVVHGHEELFFEFGTTEARDDCEMQLLREIDSLHNEAVLNPDTGDSTLTPAKIRLVEGHLGVDIPIMLEDNTKRKYEITKPLQPLKFTLLTIGSRGDVQPYIALGMALMKEGHSVKIVTHAEFQEFIESHGIEFAMIAGDPSELISLMVSHSTLSYSWLRDAKAKFSTWIDDLLQTSWKACQGTDVLIESPSSFVGIHISERLQIPYFRAFTMPWSRTRAYPHAFMVPDQKLGGSYNYMTHVAFENGYWRGVESQVNNWRVNTLGIPATTLGYMEQNSIPFLYNISPVVFPPPVDFPEWVKVTGYWFLDDGTVYDPPAEIVKFIKDARDDGMKLVYIGFGSVVVNKPAELSKAVANAVIQAGVRCILNKGWSDRLASTAEKSDEMIFPDQIYCSGSIPHDWLFPQLDAAVHHGGSGTTGASLKAGLPTVIKPFFGDQKFYASRVEDLGCGVALKELTSKSLAHALKEVTTNKRIQEKAAAVGRKIRAENGVKKAIDAIYSEMEYSRSVSIKKSKMWNGKETTETDEEDVEQDLEELDLDEEEPSDSSYVLL